MQGMPAGRSLGPVVKERGGFTLIELLVVIAVICLLAAILFPVFARARENARRASCQSNLKQLALGVMQYTQDYDERMPIVNRLAVSGESPKAFYSGAGGGNYGSYTWVDATDPYVKSAQILLCPSDSLKGRYATAGTYGQISYGMNRLMGVTLTDLGSGNYTYDSSKGRTLSSITHPSDKILLGDVYHQSQYAGPILSSTSNTADYGYYNFPLDMEIDGSTAFGAAAVGRSWNHGGRHFDGANVTFVDGHVKFLPGNTPGAVFVESGTCASGSCGKINGFNTTDQYIALWVPTR